MAFVRLNKRHIILCYMYLREILQLRMISNQTEDVLHAVGRNVVTVEIQVSQAGDVALQRGGDALQVLVVEPGVTEHQRRHVITGDLQRCGHLVDLYTS